MRLLKAICLPALVLFLNSGCSPVSTVVKLGLHVVGGAVDNAEVQKLETQLVNQPPSAADAALGQRSDVWNDLNSSRMWLLYPTQLDVLNQQRYVVECINNQIVSVALYKKNAGETDIPLALVYYEKVKGKSPSECEAILGLGPPLLAARSQNTGEMLKIYDAKSILELQDNHQCVLWFGSDGLCKKVNFIKVTGQM